MEWLVVTAILVVGVNTLLWGTVGLIRYVTSRRDRDRPRPTSGRVDRSRVAVLIAARNEESVIASTLRSACRQVGPAQVFVVSDGSTDRTAWIARALGTEVLELSPNRGKAGALVAALEGFGLMDRFEVVLFLDADTTLAEDYFATGLAEFDDPEVVAVAGRAMTRLDPPPASTLGRFLLAYRERYYLAVQYLLKYGQAARAANAVSIVPGFASMYRTGILRRIDIGAPGLVIEDFNMTFEVHAHRLGRIAFRPGSAIAGTQDPVTFRDYTRQMHRWTLGFWQTVRRHRLHGEPFWAALVLYVAELVVSSVLLVAVVPLLAASLMSGAWAAITGDRAAAGLSAAIPGWALLVAVLVPDLLLTLFAICVSRRVPMLRYAPWFTVMRIVDAAICLRSLVEAFDRRRVASGRWTSPVRRRGPEDDLLPPAPPRSPAAPAQTGPASVDGVAASTERS